jgi:hypothetical protein
MPNRRILPKILLAATIFAGVPAVMAGPASAAVDISIQIEPPALPVYEQPPIPDVGYLWTPGYWAYDQSEGYYWIPGTWVEPPSPGLLWTPAYWGWADGNYSFHEGYWGDHVGFYGGINYGFGYGGEGFEGAQWADGHLTYNSTVNNFGSVHVTNVFEKNVTVINNTQVSFNGGEKGVHAQPSQADIAVEHEHHVAATSVQTRHFTEAAHNPELSAKANGGHPAIAATAKPGEFKGAGVVAARAGGERAGAPGGGVGRPEGRPPEGARPEEHAAPGAPHPEEHANPAARPEEHAAPHPEERPGVAPHPEERPAAAAPHPEEHAAPRPEERPAAAAPHPEEHAAPHPEERPAAGAPHPEEHAAPAAQHPEEHAAQPPHPAEQHPGQPPAKAPAKEKEDEKKQPEQH